MSGLGLQQNILLPAYSGIRVGGKAAWYAEICEKKELQQALVFAAKNKLPVVPIGSGSNAFYASGKLNILVLKNNLKGIEIISQDNDFIEAELASGEIWDEAVAWSVESGFAGIEALSAIPGTVGAAPVQNIGAYGQDISETLLSVQVIEVATGKEIKFSKADCQFSYRDSIFKQQPNTYFITSVTLRLQKNTNPGVPDYKSAQDYFAGKKNTNPSLQEIRDGITEIRWSKLPRPEVLPNCGSWFKNPIIANQEFESLPDLKDCPHWPVGDSKVKLAAGWLVEKTVGKDYDNEYFATYGKNALVIINHSLSPSPKKLLKFEEGIKNKVQEKFNIELDREPILVK